MWRCPKCSATKRLWGTVVATSCACSDPPVWMQLIQVPRPEKPKFDRIVIAMDDDPPPPAAATSPEPEPSSPPLAESNEFERSAASEVEFAVNDEAIEAESDTGDEFESSPEEAADATGPLDEPQDATESQRQFPEGDRKRRSKRGRRRDRKPKNPGNGEASVKSPPAPPPEPDRAPETHPAPEAAAPPSDGFGEGIDP